MNEYRMSTRLDAKYPGWRLEYNGNVREAWRVLILGSPERQGRLALREQDEDTARELDFSALGFGHEAEDA